MFGLLMKTFTMFMAFTDVAPQHMLGGQLDKDGCYTGAGFEWCGSLDRCVRPWVNSCPPPPSETPVLTQPSPPVLMPAPSPPSPPPLKLGDVCRSGGVVIDKVTCPSGSKCVPSGQLVKMGEYITWICEKSKEPSTMPKNCKSWYDGCNRCHVNNDGTLLGCTRMICFTQSEPNCISYYRDDELKLNDICYRYCEDGSKPTINIKSKCPKYTTCGNNLIGFDTCNNPMKCIAGN